MSLAKLILSEPFKATKHILIHKNPFVIGRTAESDLVLDRTSISKRHAHIVFDGEGHMLEDLQSKNGTLLNGQIIQEAVPINNGDMITLGGVDIVFKTIQQEELNADVKKNMSRIKSAIEFTKSLSTNLFLDPILDEIINALMLLSQAERGFLLMENDEGVLQMVRSVNITPEEIR